MRLDFGLANLVKKPLAGGGTDDGPLSAAAAKAMLDLPADQFYGAYLEARSELFAPGGRAVDDQRQLDALIGQGGAESLAEWMESGAFKEPLVMSPALRETLGVVAPGYGPDDKDWGVGELAAWVAAQIAASEPDKPVLAVDVATQEEASPRLSLNEWAEYMGAMPGSALREERGVLNLISLEFSKTQLADAVRSPHVVRNVGWVETLWPSDMELTGAPAAYYCLMGAKGSYTDFHVDFGGTSVWYHVVRGRKVFYVAPPSRANLRAYQTWCESKRQSEVFFPDLLPRGEFQTLVVPAGHTLLIPSGYIHGVHTPEDSLVFGGNFIHTGAVSMQLRVFFMEDALGVDATYRYPQFVAAHWLAAAHYATALPTVSSPSDYLIKALDVLLAALKTWVAESVHDLPPHLDLARATELIDRLDTVLAEHRTPAKPQLAAPPKPKRPPLSSRKLPSTKPVLVSAKNKKASAAKSGSFSSVPSAATAAAGGISFGLSPVFPQSAKPHPPASTPPVPSEPAPAALSVSAPPPTASAPEQGKADSDTAKGTDAAAAAALAAFASAATTTPRIKLKAPAAVPETKPKLKINLGSRPNDSESDDDDDEDDDDDDDDDRAPAAGGTTIKIRTSVQPAKMNLKPQPSTKISLTVPPPRAAKVVAKAKSRSAARGHDSDESYEYSYEYSNDSADNDFSGSSDDAFMQKLQKRAAARSRTTTLSKYGRRRKNRVPKDFIAIADNDDEVDAHLEALQAQAKRGSKAKAKPAPAKSVKRKRRNDDDDDYVPTGLDEADDDDFIDDDDDDDDYEPATVRAKVVQPAKRTKGLDGSAKGKAGAKKKPAKPFKAKKPSARKFFTNMLKRRR
ncbi:PHD finger protein 8 [Thecamonas trahens ATCC 50062]|uniref:PHD finger protein 8 n=1 Tax=Thecamonas trahens ATCC 50062 TaxID=461836 RepID=A0A0L0DHA6_THETB|nr:PHD finger protein 8 [Thecamonas trahens ATCC 50062]KNC51570.1 PHD finger protein 8 [Thecamonas trahens ATCC 50062]|eukprot:XP_013755972.1 PHD finger protein 8 [Thecamonas trahens ATCC 50062]